MKVGAAFDPRAHAEVQFVGSDGLYRQVPQATQAAAARRLAAATAARCQATATKPTAGRGCGVVPPRPLPPRPIPVTPCYRSVFHTPASPQVLHQEVGFCHAHEATPAPRSPYRVQEPLLSRHPEPASPGPRAPRSPPRSASELPFTGPARDTGSVAEAAAASFAPRSLQVPSGVGRPERRRREEDDGGHTPLQEHRSVAGPSRTPTRAPSANSRGAERTYDAPKVRTRSIDVARGITFNVAIARRGQAAQRPPPVEDDCAEYSDRFLPGYEKTQLLGRGACAVVWLAVPSGSRTPVAIKQVAKGTTGKKKSDTDAARKEILFGSYFFEAGGEPKVSPKQNPGIAHIAKLLDYVETKRDIWMVMEFGGTSLTKMAYEIKGEFHRGERLYKVVHLPLYESMKRDPRVLKAVLRQLLSALCLFSEHRVVHSDIKPDNILIDEDDRSHIRARFIDLGSAFSFDAPSSLSVATPEYMPHEGLEVCAVGRNLGVGGARMTLGSRAAGGGPAAGAKSVDSLQRQSQPWSFDMWSLGSILLEMGLGTPLWLSYKCRVASDQRNNAAGLGLFAVPGRDPEKILLRQADAICQRGLAAVLRGAPGVPLEGGGEFNGLDLLERMMAWDPLERISPHEALAHPWLQD